MIRDTLTYHQRNSGIRFMRKTHPNTKIQKTKFLYVQNKNLE